ncbi:MAG: putative oxidoreductase C-terminal domain-containing protein [Ginsengibacter sp.]
MFGQGCISNNQEEKGGPALTRLIVLDPGHFHAALLQKFMNKDVDSIVYVFAPEGPDVKSYLALIDEYNGRKEDPTNWKEKVYLGPDFLEKMLNTKPGNVVVIAGNNKMKTDYIKKAVNAGLNVLADKPMAINKAGFDSLQKAFTDAKKNKVLLYDIMTERYEITNILQKAFSMMPDVFGKLQNGTLENPAISLESAHYFFKEVSGKPLIRPAWYLDVDQEGEGIVDVTTHMVDLIQWECFSGENLDYKNDIQMLAAKRWPTVLTSSQFRQITKKDAYPDFLKKDVKDSLLNVYANGEMNYTIKGTHARVSVAWKFQAPEGSGDTFYSILRGTKANLIIRQNKEQQYKPVLYIEPVNKDNEDEWNQLLQESFKRIHQKYTGVELSKSQNGWQVIIPDTFKIAHEQQFALVIKKYIEYHREGKMPEWEISSTLAKYYTTTQALEKALNE